jgi:steroid 5-alpha reductase family enzyme
VTLLEKSLKQSKGPAYERYISQTNAFFPGPRKA